MNHNQQTGAAGEELACGYLRNKGYTIVAKNWRGRGGEIDIIARDGATLVFVEVKTRQSRVFGYPEDALTRTKREHIRRVSEQFCLERRWTGAVRVDVLAVLSNRTPPEVVHFENCEV